VSHFVGLDLVQSAEHTALAVVEDVPQQTPWGSTSYPDIALVVAVMMRSNIPDPPPAWSSSLKGR
jgi:hypothetical protein